MSSDYSVSRKTALEAVVIVKLNALLDIATARALGGAKPDVGLWNGITRQPFTDGTTCTSDTDALLISPNVVMKKVSIRDRKEGSSQETGSGSTATVAAVISFPLDPDTKPYTYCWHTIVFGGNSSIAKEVWYDRDA